MPGALREDRAGPFEALRITPEATFPALRVTLARSRSIEMSSARLAMILRVTPIVAIAPPIFVHAHIRRTALLPGAWIVAFLPVLANTMPDLEPVDHDAFATARARGRQRPVHLEPPSAHASVPGGPEIAGGLSLVGAVMTEYVAGTGGQASRPATASTSRACSRPCFRSWRPGWRSTG